VRTVREDLTPAEALVLGLKVDVDALPQPIVQAFEAGAVDVDDAAVNPCTPATRRRPSTTTAAKCST
jgi:hypothetical protein